ncbi:hypothetical protein VPH35_098859 [Triticum aestivum]|uniref:Uncharacterized protein n=1 Tax=Aegilops tauschii subsp. strangulata TaxID=200361 RepID=A0A453LCJ9_AEGTS
MSSRPMWRMVRASWMSRRPCCCPTGAPVISAASDGRCASYRRRKTPCSRTSTRRRRKGRRTRPRMLTTSCRPRRLDDEPGRPCPPPSKARKSRTWEAADAWVPERPPPTSCRASQPLS